jgi:hypothetical protein
MQYCRLYVLDSIIACFSSSFEETEDTKDHPPRMLRDNYLGNYEMSPPGNQSQVSSKHCSPMVDGFLLNLDIFL